LRPAQAVAIGSTVLSRITSIEKFEVTLRHPNLPTARVKAISEKVDRLFRFEIATDQSFRVFWCFNEKPKR
jgi:hypothetical protein